MNKRYLLFIIVFLLLITSCGKVVQYYNNDDSNIWANSFYEVINTSGNKYVGFDLRTNSDYQTKHLKQLQNYDLSTNSLEDFINYLKNNYNKDYQIYIYYDKDINLDNLKKDYKKIDILILNYDKLENNHQDLFIFDSGDYDCGC